MSSTVITCISTVVLSLIATTMINAQGRSAPIQISWSNSREVICVYNVHAAPANRVKVQLMRSGKVLDTGTKVWEGGIDSLLAVTERASKEVNSTERKPGKSNHWWKLTVRYMKGNVQRSFSVEGDIDELFKFYSNTVDLQALLHLVSGDAPKNYQLIFEGGPHRGTMRKPDPLPPD